MLYFKHVELADKFGVSLKTVYNWIESAKQGNLNLELYDTKNKIFIANTANNIRTLELQAARSKKYRNTLHRKVVAPTEKFYNLYSNRQILDIISNLSIHREIPRQYNYFNSGAKNWERFAEHMWTDKGPNLLKASIHLLDANISAIEKLIEGHNKINIIDIGPGNARPVKDLIKYLLHKKLLHRYIALDISEGMLTIAKRNIEEWFGDNVKFEGYVRDITHERFDDVIVEDMLQKDADKTINLLLLLGATPMNFPAPYDLLKVIYSSMGPKDLLFYTDKPDTPQQRRDFDVNTYASTTALSPKYSFIFDLLNIDESLYDVEMGFNEDKRWRYIQVRLKTALTINFKFKDVERHVDLDKGETILLWRGWHQTTLEIVSEFERTGLSLVHANLSQDRQFLLTISGVAQS